MSQPLYLTNAEAQALHDEADGYRAKAQDLEAILAKLKTSCERCQEAIDAYRAAAADLYEQAKYGVLTVTK